MIVKSWALIAVGVALAALALYVVIQHLELTAARANVAALAAEITLAKSTNESNLEVIAAQGKALDTWAGEAEKGVAAAKEAARELTAAQAARTQVAAALAAREAKDRALPACVSLLATDLNRICPDHAKAIQERAK